MIACLPFVFPLLINHKYNDAYNYIPYLVLGTVFNVAICLYSQVYLAKKLSKQVASTAILGAIINIVLNLVFIKQIGLYAAAISTAISYFVMMVYRHIDLKKYVNIKLSKGLVINSIIMFTFTIFMYYQKDLILNIISLTVAIAYALLINMKFLKGSWKTVLGKIKK